MDIHANTHIDIIDVDVDIEGIHSIYQTRSTRPDAGTAEEMKRAVTTSVLPRTLLWQGEKSM